MTLTIELTPEQRAALESEASAHGMELPEFAKLRLLKNGTNPVSPTRTRQPRLRRRVMGKYAGLLTDSETFAAEKQHEIAREEDCR